MLLESDEQLDYLMVDDEGKLPKDICPFNSPVYKMLMKYERIVLDRAIKPH